MSTDDRAAPRPDDPAAPITAPGRTEPRVWLYAFSAAGQGVAIEAQFQQLMATVATSSGAVAGRSSDTGSGYTSERPGWDDAVAAVVAGRAAAVAVVSVDRLGREPGAAIERATAISRAGGQLWTSDSERLDVVDLVAPGWQGP